MIRNGLGKVLVLSLGVTICLASTAQAPGPNLPPGGAIVKGNYNAATSTLSLDLMVAQTAGKANRIFAVEVFTEPSHTLAYALVDQSAPNDVRMSIRSDRPDAKSESTIGDAFPHAEIKDQQIGKDTGVRLVYWISSNGQPKRITVADAILSDMSSFGFECIPGGIISDSGGGPRQCGYCGEQLCGCVYCIRFYLCCPACTISCTPVVCQ